MKVKTVFRGFFSVNRQYSANPQHCNPRSSGKKRKFIREMELNLNLEKFAKLVKSTKQEILAKAAKYGKRGVPVSRVDEGSCAVKASFYRLFGIEWSEVKENVDERNWRRNIADLYQGKESVDFCIAGVSPSKRARRSLNDSLNESLLAGFD